MSATGPKQKPFRQFSQADEDEAVRLMKRLAEHDDEDAYATLVQRFQCVMMNGAFSSIRNFHDAQDAAQNGWLSIWLHRERYATYPCAISIIFAVGRSAAGMIIQARYAKKRGGKHPDWLEDEVRAALYNVATHRHRKNMHVGVAGQLVETERTPCNDTSRLMGQVHRLVYKMPPALLGPLDSFYFKGESMEEMATRRGCSKMDVAHTLHEGIQLMRHFIAKEPPVSTAFEETEAA